MRARVCVCGGWGGGGGDPIGLTLGIAPIGLVYLCMPKKTKKMKKRPFKCPRPSAFAEYISQHMHMVPILVRYGFR